VLAHAQSGPNDLTAFAFVGAIVAVAAVWLVRINRRLDAKEDPMSQPEKRSLMRWLPLAVIVILMGVGAVVVFQAQSDLGSEQAQLVVDDLCLAAAQATSDPAAALATFNGAPHNALHSIDIDLRKVDPMAAAQLATAKQQAEAAMIARSPDAAPLAATLAEQTAEAYRTLDADATINSCL